MIHEGFFIVRCLTLKAYYVTLSHLDLQWKNQHEPEEDSMYKKNAKVHNIIVPKFHFQCRKVSAQDNLWSLSTNSDSTIWRASYSQLLCTNILRL